MTRAGPCFKPDPFYATVKSNTRRFLATETPALGLDMT